MIQTIDKTLLIPEWPAPSNIKACVTTRQTGDMSVNGGHRIALKNQLDLATTPAWLEQVHGCEVLNLDQPVTSFKADASYTSTQGLACVVLTGDCLPVFITNRQGDFVAALHVGWRGLHAGIIDETVRKLNVPTIELIAWLGPAIGPDHFEVGPEVRELFITRNPQFSAGFKSHTQDRYWADLYLLARINLQACGVTQLYGGDLCTYCDHQRFFSYRREKSVTGRMASLIWID